MNSQYSYSYRGTQVDSKSIELLPYVVVGTCIDVCYPDFLLKKTIKLDVIFCIILKVVFFIDHYCGSYVGLNNILFTVTLTYYDIYMHTIFLGFDGKR